MRTRKPRTVETTEPTAEAPLSDGDEYVYDAGSSVGELFEEQMEDFEPDQAHDRALVFTPAQLAAIQDTVSSTVQAALSSFPNREATARMYLDQSTPTPRSQNVATPLGLNRPMDKSLKDKILRGEYIDFCLLLPDTIYRSQSPALQLRYEESSPGSQGSPLTEKASHRYLPKVARCLYHLHAGNRRRLPQQILGADQISADHQSSCIKV